MRRILIIATLVQIMSSSAYAGWWRTYGEVGCDQGQYIKETKDSCYVVVGFKNRQDIWLLKLDRKGDSIWTRIYPGGEGFCLQTTSDNGYIICGEKQDKLWLIKVDSDGNKLWERNDYQGTGTWMEKNSEGGYIVTGWLGGSVWLLKLDVNGDTIWSRCYGCGPWEDAGLSVVETRDSKYLILAWGTEWNFTLPYSYMRLLKVDKEGKLVWEKDYVELNGWSSLHETSDGGFIITGGVLIKADEYGDTIWTHSYFNSSYSAGGFFGHQMKDDNYIITGLKAPSVKEHNIWLMKADSIGDTLWTRTFGDSGRNEGHCVQETSDGGFVITGVLGWDQSAGDIIIIKTDSLGLLGISEPPPVTHPLSSDFEILSPIGSIVTLRYSNCPHGFHASVYDATGRRVDEIITPNQSGVLVWGPRQNPGVYFIVADTDSKQVSKVILVK